MKKFLCIALMTCLLIMPVLNGCKNADLEIPHDPTGDGTTDDQNGQTTAEATTEAPFKLESWNLGDKDISEYKIVYSKVISIALERRYKDLLGEDYDYYKVVAEKLAETIKAEFGVTVPVVLDTATSASDLEILVGDTDRAESKASDVSELGDNNYAIVMKGKKLVIKGGQPGSTYHALDEIEKEFAAAKEAKTANITWAADKSIKGEYKLKKVACVGDSLTAGSQATNKEMFYPQQLQRILWRDYIVYNYGYSGRTMRDDSANTYTATQEYKDCIAGSGYDLVCIMLGTNDTAYASWDNVADGKAKFLSSAKGIIDAIKKNSPNAKFVIMNCPEAYGKFQVNPTLAKITLVRETQLETAQALKNQGYSMFMYNMFKYTDENLTLEKDYAADQLHMSDYGYRKVAEGVAELVSHVFDGKENKYVVPLS